MSKLNLLYYIKKYRFNSVFFKNLIAIVLCITIPFGIISLIIYINSAAALKSETELLSQQRLERLTQNADDFIRSMDKLCVVTLQNTSVQKAFSIEGSKINMSGEYINIMNTVTAFYQIHNYINNISVYTKLNNCVITPTAVIESGDCNLPLMKRYPESNKEREIFVGDSNGADIKTVTIMRRAIYGSKSIGAAAIDVYINRMFEGFGIPVNDEAEQLIIVDNDNNILLSSDMRNIGRPFNDVVKIKKSTAYIDGRRYIVAQNQSAIDGLKYVYVSDEQLYRHANEKMVQMSFLLIFFVLILSLLIAVYISVKTYRPINEIINYFEQNTEGEEESNELGYITRNIIMLENENLQLTEEMQQRIIMLNKAQLQALQGQMNPHFIHNTLETIKWLVAGLEEDDSRASDMIEILSSIIRYSMDMENYLVDVDEEVLQAKKYVEILKIRFEDDFDVEWNVDPDTTRLKILKLSIQPLIENAMNHGIIPSPEKGKITINIFLKNDCLYVEVFDNGIGIQPDELEKLRKRLDGVMLLEGRTVGLYNVNLRVKLVYGDEYGITVESVPRSGTKVTLIMGANNECKKAEL